MRAVLYARVSSEEQVEGYSIDAQRRAFQALCQGREWKPYREYIEEGKSARTENVNKRPVFKQMVDDALSREFDILVVHKLDRFSRNLRITLEYFEKLSNVNVCFVSINEQMDFSQPWGKFALAMLGGLAQLYSDNLNEETKKGWHERRAQGLYCGLLPFGAMKDEDGVPIPHPDTYPGLEMAFELAARGKSDREIAKVLNTRGYRTAGNQGSNPFSRDTIRGILTNRFYLGFLPDGNSGWMKGKHEAFIPPELFGAVQQSRRRNATNPAKTTRSDAKPCSLSGVARCAECGGTLRVQHAHGRIRLGCSTRLKGGNCPQVSGYLDIYEQQLQAYLEAFHIPEDYQEKIFEAHQKLQSAYSDVDKQRTRIKAALQRLEDLYQWGHKSKQEYLAEYNSLRQELELLEPTPGAQNLDKLAQFLKNVALAWKEANQEQRNRLAHQLFESVWIKDQKVLAVTPRPELRSFFDLEYQGVSHNILQMRPRGGSTTAPDTLRVTLMRQLEEWCHFRSWLNLSNSVILNPYLLKDGVR
jgi:DNA invertase Pin-like site-specific DNA recombinase